MNRGARIRQPAAGAGLDRRQHDAGRSLLEVGEDVSHKLKTATWGEGVVEELARYLQRRQPGLNGFTRANLFRMRQFYDTYRDEAKVAPVVRQLPGSHNLLILGRCKRPEEREFYLRLAQRDHWSGRELERQGDGQK